MLHREHHANYIAAGALSEPRVMEALLGKLPASHRMDLQGFTLGLVVGDDVNGRMRNDIVDPTFRTRVLVPRDHSSVTVRLYTGLTPDEFDAIRAFTYEGVITREGTTPIGNGHESVGEALMHVAREDLAWTELPSEAREEFPNGFEATVAAAELTRRRLDERHHGRGPERR